MLWLTRGALGTVHVEAVRGSGSNDVGVRVPCQVKELGGVVCAGLGGFCGGGAALAAGAALVANGKAVGLRRLVIGGSSRREWSNMCSNALMKECLGHACKACSGRCRSLEQSCWAALGGAALAGATLVANGKTVGLR